MNERTIGRTGPPLILVVEDEGLEANATEEQLRAMGYAVSATVRSAEEAHHVAGMSRPDLVLMDIRIYGALDGIETAISLRENFGVPVVFVTGSADDRTLDRVKGAEPVGYLIKPYTRSDLHVAIELGLHKHALNEQLREREHWFSTTLRSIGDGVLAVDALGFITFVNAAAEKTLGSTSANLTGRPLSEVVAFRADATGEAVPSPVAEVLRTRKIARIPPGTSLVTVDGRATPIDDTATPIVDQEGRTLGAVFVFKDTSERRRLETQLATSERLASLGVLAAGVAHELNNPLAFALANLSFGISKLAEISAEEPAVAMVLEDVHAALSDATTGTERAARIVRELRESVRPRHGALQRVGLASVANLAVRHTANEVRKRAQCVVRVPENLFVLADNGRLTQVLVNLIVNAAQATPEGASSPLISLDAHADGDHVVIRVSDAGAGMSVEVQKRIFEPFFSTKDHDAGMGLGLALVHGFVTAFGGTITVDSGLGGGTTFEIRLRSAPEGQATSIAPTPATAGRRSRLLVIDDEPMILSAVERMLSTRHDVTTAHGGATGLDLIRTADPPFDVILCDVTMPRLGGRAVRDRLVASAAAMLPRVVFMSGGATNAESAAFLDEVTYIAKPFTLAELERAIADVLVTTSSAANGEAC